MFVDDVIDFLLVSRSYPISNEKEMQLYVAKLLQHYKNEPIMHDLVVPKRFFKSIKEVFPLNAPFNRRITVYVDPNCAMQARELAKNGIQVRVAKKMSCNQMPFLLLSDFVGKRFIKGEWKLPPIQHCVMFEPNGFGACVVYVNRNEFLSGRFLHAIQDTFRVLSDRSVPLSEWQKNKAITKQNIPFPNNAEQGRGSREN